MRIPFLGHFKVHFNEGMDKKCSFSEKILGFFGENQQWECPLNKKKYLEGHFNEMIGKCTFRKNFGFGKMEIECLFEVKINKNWKKINLANTMNRKWY